MRRVSSAKQRLGSAIAKLAREDELTGKQRIISSWIGSLQSDPPDVLLGANFAEFGGVREHLHAIVKYSTLRADLAPPDSVVKSVGAHHVAHTFRQQLLEFDPQKIRAIHSHVYPWFIEWCRHHQKRGTRWVHTYHLPYFPEHSRGSLEPWQVEFNNALINEARHADVRISVAKWQQVYLQTFGIATDYIPNGVDLAASELADAGKFSSPFGREPFALYVGRDDPVKNPRAFAELAAQLPTKRFVMAGRGLTKNALQAGWGIDVPSNLALVGELPHSGILDAIAASSVVVVTSYREGLPTLVLEAMSQSKMIVIPNEQGCMEATADGDFALVYQPGNLDDLAAKTLAGLKDGRKNSGARERILLEYDWRVVAPQLDGVYTGTGTW
jgi:glycosyltransferase involved in cell wall biosynthesis